MSYILGLHTGHTSTASLMKDGKIISCVSEERLVREKEWGGFPKEAIIEVIDIARIKPTDIEHVSVAGFLEPVTSFANRDDKWFRRLYRRSSFVLPKKLFQSPGIIKRAVNFAGRNKNLISQKLRALALFVLVIFVASYASGFFAPVNSY